MAKRIGIGMVLHSVTGGGIQTVVKTLARELTAKGMEVHVFVHKEFNPDDSVADLLLHDLSGIKGDQARADRVRAIAKDLREQVEFAAFFGHSYGSYGILDCLQHPNTYYCIHRDYAEDVRNQSWFARPLKARKYRRLFGKRNLIVVSEGIAKGLVGMGIQRKDMRVIYNPVPVESIRTLASEPVKLPNAPYLVYVGSLIARKRVDLLLNASAAFLRQHPEYQVLLVGDGVLRQSLGTQAEELGIAPQVHFVGQQSNPYPYIRGARLLVLPSDSEAFGLVLMEASALGVPMVATDCPGPVEIMRGPLSDYLAPKGDVKAMSRIIEKALVEPYPEVELAAELKTDFCIAQYYELCKQSNGWEI